MNDAPRQTLRDLIARHGPGLCADARRCEGLLRDLCGAHRREINILIGALKERVPLDLLAAQGTTPRRLLLTRLAKRLEDHLALTGNAARWAVDSWALALGVATAEEVALEWFFPQMGTPEQRAAIELLVRKGPPSEHFLWPLEITTASGVAGFGYVMPLRPARFKNIVDLMTRRIEPSFRALATAGLNLSHNYLLLHSQGLCYRDISFGNAFFDPDNGDVLIADNDNVSVDGAGVLGVLGTPRFMAPEVVRGEAVPSTQTDLFSLSVLIFYMLTVAHPLEGKKETEIRCLDLPAMTRLYGTEPLFIFDPRDDSNAPVPGVHDNALAFWRIYPQYLRDLFTRAFTDGLRDPLHGRVRESEWRGAVVALRDAIFYCAHCSLENFYDGAALKARGGRSGLCWSCAAELRLPPRVRIGKSVAMLNHDTQLFPHHVDDQRLYDFSAPVAAVAAHPSDSTVWGLKNLSRDKWFAVAPGGPARDVEPGRSVTLAVGTKIQFGRAEAEIRV